MVKSYDTNKATNDTAKDFFGSEQVKNELKNDFEKFLAKGFKLIHSGTTREALIKMVTDSPNKLDGISSAVTLVVNKIDEVSRGAQHEVHDAVKINAATVFTGDIATIAKVKLDDKQLKTTVALCIQKYLSGEIQAGRIDPQILQQQLSESTSRLSPEEQEEADMHMREIDETAQSSEQEMIQGAQGAPAESMVNAEVPPNGI